MHNRRNSLLARSFRCIWTEKFRTCQPEQARYQHHKRDHQKADIEIPPIWHSSNQRRRNGISQGVHDENCHGKCMARTSGFVTLAIAVFAGPILKKRKKTARKQNSHARGNGVYSIASVHGNASNIPQPETWK